MIRFTGLVAKAWETPTDISPGADPPDRKHMLLRSRETLCVGGKAFILMSLDTDISRTYRRWHCSASWPDRRRDLDPKMVEPLLKICRAELGTVGKQEGEPLVLDKSNVNVLQALGEATKLIMDNPDHEVVLITAKAVHILRPLSLEEHVELTGRNAAVVN